MSQNNINKIVDYLEEEISKYNCNLRIKFDDHNTFRELVNFYQSNLIQLPAVKFFEIKFGRNLVEVFHEVGISGKFITFFSIPTKLLSKESIDNICNLEQTIQYGVTCSKCSQFYPYQIKQKNFICWGCKHGF